MKIGSLLGALAVPFTQNNAEKRPENFTVTSTKNLHDFKMKSLDGKDVDLSIYKGKKVIILNTASKCGLVVLLVIVGWPARCRRRVTAVAACVQPDRQSRRLRRLVDGPILAAAQRLACTRRHVDLRIVPCGCAMLDLFHSCSRIVLADH